MASKALFAALHLDLFTHIANGTHRLEGLAQATGAQVETLHTLLITLTALGLLERVEDGWRNAPACDRYLVRDAPGDFGDYYRYQIDRQIYPMFMHLVPGLLGHERPYTEGLGQILADPDEAELFSRSQHAGSLGPAIILARQLDLSDRATLLDVAGGSGAFSITLCRANPRLRSTIIDFPRVIDVARRFVSEAELDQRIHLLPGDAFEVEWPHDVDVVLMSYLLSAVPGERMASLCEKAFGALRPGGLFVIHDFMLSDEKSGPLSAALWFLSYATNTHRPTSFSPKDLKELLGQAGFADASSGVVIPEITGLVTARKPE